MTSPEPRCDLEGCDCEGTDPSHFEVPDSERCAWKGKRYDCKMPARHYWHTPSSEWYDHAFVPPKETRA
jgi:hypothetical protein